MMGAAKGPWAIKFEVVIPENHLSRMIGGSTNPKDDEANYAHEICRVDGKYQDNEANARLIAAAPELLDALEAACSLIIAEVADGAYTEQAKAARAAINKATGRTA